MKVLFERSFEKDLRKINDATLLQNVKIIISEIKQAGDLGDIRHLSKLKGYKTFYRIRVGDYRLGVDVVDDTVILTRFLHRKDIYRYFP
ncbi:MAG: type II toxin-antitoxin system toxin RelE3 [Anaerolineae bacterium]